MRKKRTIDLGGVAPAKTPNAQVRLDGGVWGRIRTTILQEIAKRWLFTHLAASTSRNAEEALVAPQDRGRLSGSSAGSSLSTFEFLGSACRAKDLTRIVYRVI